MPCEHYSTVNEPNCATWRHSGTALQPVLQAAGRVTVKDSCARNLHRLLCVVTFMRVLLEKLAESESVSIKDAASAAYEAVRGLQQHLNTPCLWIVTSSNFDSLFMASHATIFIGLFALHPCYNTPVLFLCSLQSLSPIHIYVVRAAVWAGMYVLPSRAAFMQSVRVQQGAGAAVRDLVNVPN